MPERGCVENAQQLRLSRWAHLTYLVQGDRSAIGDFERSGLGALRSGEGATLVSE